MLISKPWAMYLRCASHRLCLVYICRVTFNNILNIFISFFRLPYLHSQILFRILKSVQKVLYQQRKLSVKGGSSFCCNVLKVVLKCLQMSSPGLKFHQDWRHLYLSLLLFLNLQNNAFKLISPGLLFTFFMQKLETPKCYRIYKQDCWFTYKSSDILSFVYWESFITHPFIFEFYSFNLVYVNSDQINVFVFYKQQLPQRGKEINS